MSAGRSALLLLLRAFGCVVGSLLLLLSLAVDAGSCLMMMCWWLEASIVHRVRSRSGWLVVACRSVCLLRL